MRVTKSGALSGGFHSDKNEKEKARRRTDADEALRRQRRNDGKYPEKREYVVIISTSP